MRRYIQLHLQNQNSGVTTTCTYWPSNSTSRLCTVQQTAVAPSQKAKQSSEFEPVPGCELAVLFQSRSRPTSNHESLTNFGSTFACFSSPMTSGDFPFRLRLIAGTSAPPCVQSDIPAFVPSVPLPRVELDTKEDELQGMPASTSSSRDNRKGILPLSSGKSPELPVRLASQSTTSTHMLFIDQTHMCTEVEIVNMPEMVWEEYHYTKIETNRLNYKDIQNPALHQSQGCRIRSIPVPRRILHCILFANLVLKNSMLNLKYSHKIVKVLRDWSSLVWLDTSIIANLRHGQPITLP